MYVMRPKVIVRNEYLSLVDEWISDSVVVCARDIPQRPTAQSEYFSDIDQWVSDYIEASTCIVPPQLEARYEALGYFDESSRLSCATSRARSVNFIYADEWIPDSAEC